MEYDFTDNVNSDAFFGIAEKSGKFIKKAKEIFFDESIVSGNVTPDVSNKFSKRSVKGAQ